MDRRRRVAALCGSGAAISSSALLLATRHLDHGGRLSPAFFVGLAVGVATGLIVLGAAWLITGRRPGCR